eukprot:NODE_382_length_8372_cov_0.676538.p1 type:complete len:595 gc:universal NODE_382_length_8372_cov_0.676538:5419-3635(-)
MYLNHIIICISSHALFLTFFMLISLIFANFINLMNCPFARIAQPNFIKSLYNNQAQPSHHMPYIINIESTSLIIHKIHDLHHLTIYSHPNAINPLNDITRQYQSSIQSIFAIPNEHIHYQSIPIPNSLNLLISIVYCYYPNAIDDALDQLIPHASELHALQHPSQLKPYLPIDFNDYEISELEYQMAIKSKYYYISQSVFNWRLNYLNIASKSIRNDYQHGNFKLNHLNQLPLNIPSQICYFLYDEEMCGQVLYQLSLLDGVLSIHIYHFSDIFVNTRLGELKRKLKHYRQENIKKVSIYYHNLSHLFKLGFTEYAAILLVLENQYKGKSDDYGNYAYLMYLKDILTDHVHINKIQLMPSRQLTEIQLKLPEIKEPFQTFTQAQLKLNRDEIKAARHEVAIQTDKEMMAFQFNGEELLQDAAFSYFTYYFNLRSKGHVMSTQFGRYVANYEYNQMIQADDWELQFPLIIPVFIGSDTNYGHWMTIVVENHGKYLKIDSFDFLNPSGHLETRVKKSILYFLKFRGFKSFKWYQYSLKLQHDGHSCGVYSLVVMDLFTKGETLENLSELETYLRRDKIMEQKSHYYKLYLEKQMKE